MTHKDLSAFIPTNKEDAVNVRWGEMPFHGILTALKEHCSERVIRADDKWLVGKEKPFRAPSGSIRAIRSGPGDAADKNTRRRWVEVDVA
jgi:hypothetical protein